MGFFRNDLPFRKQRKSYFLTVSAAGNPAAVLFFVDIFLLGRYNNVLGRNSVKTLKIKD